jgi:hypothetical protein
MIIPPCESNGRDSGETDFPLDECNYEGLSAAWLPYSRVGDTHRLEPFCDELEETRKSITNVTMHCWQNSLYAELQRLALRGRIEEWLAWCDLTQEDRASLERLRSDVVDHDLVREEKRLGSL